MKRFTFRTQATVRLMFSEFTLKSQTPLRHFCIVFALVLLVIGAPATAKAQGITVYNNIPATLPIPFPGIPLSFPLNIFSQGAEA